VEPPLKLPFVMMLLPVEAAFELVDGEEVSLDTALLVEV
jgi:hypothetical protein